MSFFPIILKPLSQQAVPTTSVDNSSPSPRQNPEEDYFFWYYLDKYFPNKFKRNYLVGSYTPDFLYIDQSTGLYIDVECDEPYIYGTETPTHYRDSIKESDRNNFFLAQGIFVIRFAEEQIVKYPLNCCKAIAEVISNFTGNDFILKQFKAVNKLPLMAHWSETEAKQLAEINYRDRYLKTYYDIQGLPDRSLILEGLKSFVNVETDTQVKETRETWALPLSDRVDTGKAIANLEIISREGGLVKLKCGENLSKFAPGDRLLLNQNNPFDKNNSYECILEIEDDEILTVRMTTNSPLNDLTKGSKWVLDQQLIDLRRLLLEPLNNLPNSPTQYEAIMGILEGKVTPNIPEKLLDLGAVQKLGLLPKQEEALVKSLASKNYYVIQGPPGTGKTWLLAHLAYLLAQQGQTILITAFSHAAINNALRKIAQVTGYKRVIKIGEPDKATGLIWEGGEVRNYDKLDNSPYKNNTQGVIIGATCFSVGGPRLKDIHFDTIIFDEAGQITLPVALRGMMSGSKYIFIGDHKQMSPVIAGRHRKQWVTRSIFETLFNHTPGTMLDITHRLNAEINRFPSEYFYQGKLQPSPLAKDRKLVIPRQPQVLREVFHPDYSSIFYQVDHHNRRTSSPEEAEVIAKMVKEAISCGISSDEIAVVVPYRAQARLIRQKLQQLGIQTLQEKFNTIQVDTVESMQGQERDLMIVSLTTSDPLYAAQKAEFYFKLNRLNVAITRARVKRIIVGSPKVFTAQPQEIEYQAAVKCFRAFYESCWILPQAKPQTLTSNPTLIVEPMTIDSLFQEISRLSDNASKSDITLKIALPLLEVLGFKDGEIKNNFATGNGKETCDFVTVRPSPKYENKVAVFALLHIENRNTNFDTNNTAYKQAVANLTKDLLAPNCRRAQWGIITNSRQIQLFRKHGKVIHPASKIYDLDTSDLENFAQTIRWLKNHIDNPTSALTVAIYNNKGGVGKTTTTINLGAILTLFKYKVLVIDFDCNQGDLTQSLGLSEASVTLYDVLDSRAQDMKIKQALVTYQQKVGKEEKIYKFDVVPSDKRLVDEFDSAVYQRINFKKLNQILQPLRYEYDYILIDTPPNWTFFSQSPLYAADVVLMPTEQNNINSYTNVAKAITRYLPEIHDNQEYKRTVALPIFFNATTKISEAQLKSIHNSMEHIIKNNDNKAINLLPYFYPKYNKINQDREIFSIKENAYVTRASFLKKPAVYCYQQAIEDYEKLAKEYFIHG